ncbi:MAG: non-canonical purine NTP pyrophosphatase [Patescibacteria group bacterium]
MKPKLFIVTGSDFKFHDLSYKLKDFFDCEQRPWDEHEIQGEPGEIITDKVKKAYKKFGGAVLVDDVSVYFEFLNGFPGPYMKDFFNVMTPYEMGHKFSGTRIKAVCRLALCRGEDDIIMGVGEFNGVIVAPKEKDHKGRWFELFVKLDGTDKIMLELTDEERNKHSHRGKAMENLLELLKKENHGSKS